MKREPITGAYEIWTCWEIRGSAFIAEVLTAYFSTTGMWPGETVRTS